MQDKLLAGATGVARFTGTLDDLSVADLIQILQLAGKGAVVTVTREGQTSRLWCQEGAIIAAESGRLRGEAAVYRILAFEQGALIADLHSVVQERSIFAATQRLLLEGARRKDESTLLSDKLGDLQRCVQLREPLEEPGSSAAELVLLRSFQSPRSLLQALEESELGDFETLTALVRWLEAGQLSDTGARHTPAPPAPDETPQQASLLPLVASVAPRRMFVARDPSLPNWGWAAVAALVLAPAGYLIGSSTARSLEPAAASAPPALTAAEPAPRAPSRYPLGIQVAPAEAEIWLDGQQVARGHFETVLARDGVVHELQVSASGHVPTRILFLDAPPPRELRLDPLPVRSAELETPRGTAADPAQPGTSAASEPKGRKRSSLRTPPKRDAVRTVQHTRVAGSAAAATNMPRVQVIDGDDPVIRVLD
jgi:hypothetical protein